MKVLSLNVNDFGGSKEHLMNYKTINYRGNEVIDWNEWISRVSCQYDFKEIIQYLVEDNKDADIILFMEMPIRLTKCGPKFLFDEFSEMTTKYGYCLIGNFPNVNRAYNASMTVMLTRKEVKHIDSLVMNGYRDGRFCTIKVEDYIIHGTHIPPEGKDGYDKKYWDELEKLVNTYCKKQPLLIIGDFNTYDEGTNHKERFTELLSIGLKDIWISLGNVNKCPTHGSRRIDYALANEQLLREVSNMKIDDTVTKSSLSDHNSLVVTIQQ